MNQNIFIFTSYIPIIMFAYFALATGFTLPDTYGFSPTYSLLVVLSNMAICIFFAKRMQISIIFIYLLMIVLALLLLLTNVNKISTNALIIVFSGYLIPIMVSCWLYFLKNDLGENLFLDLWILCALIILFITILYKINFGFFDRTVRFFLNGPIVFGWLNAIMSIISIEQLSKNPSFKRLLISLIFIMATVWTFSRGPIIVLFFGITILVLTKLKFSYQSLARIILIPILMYIIFTIVQDNRIGQSFAIIFNDGPLNFFKNTPRYQFILHSIELLENNYLYGTGVDSFKYMDFTYPHNILFNLLLDGGIFYTLLFLALITFIFFNTSDLGKVLLLTGILALMFSGNTTYLRFIFILPISLIFLRDSKLKI